MPKANQVNSMIDTSLNDTREHLGTLSKAKDRPHVLDDATIDRVERVHTEQMNYVDIYTQQISRWRTPSTPMIYWFRSYCSAPGLRGS